MGRGLTAGQLAEASGQATRPQYLVRIDWSVPVYLCSHSDISYDGQTWVAWGLSLNLRPTDSGITGELTLSNPAAEWTALVLLEGVRDIPCAIWQLNGDPPYSAGDAVPLFTGQIDGAPTIGDQVRLTLRSAGIRTARSPRYTLEPWFGSDLTPEGTRISWGGQTYVLEAP